MAIKHGTTNGGCREPPRAMATMHGTKNERLRCTEGKTEREISSVRGVARVGPCHRAHRNAQWQQKSSA
eukprot:5966155-Lingulodinium_polyedra.AAC.1